MSARPQLVRPGMRVRPAMPAGVPTPVTGPMAGQIRITDPRVAQLLSNAQIQVNAMQQEVASLQVKLKHFVGILILMLRDADHYPEAKTRLKLKDFEAIPPDTAVDTDEVIGEFLTVRLTNQKEYLLKLKGLVEGTQVLKVPKRSPFTAKVDLPLGGNFEGCVSVRYKGGKLDGTELQRAQGKPKKPREFQFDQDGTFHFTTDSSGFAVEVIYVAKKAPEQEEAPATGPIECSADWHKTLDAVGFRCPECGDPRKIEELVTA